MLNLPHTLILVAELGRFHALGLALLEKGLVNKSNFTLFEFSNDQLFRSFFIGAVKAFGKAVDMVWGSEWKEAAKRINRSVEVAYEKFSKLIQIDAKRFNVINHGDCWSNNAMFKWDEMNRPVGVKFVDFQLIHYNSFAVDLTYLMYNTTQPEIRRSHYDEIVETYRKSVVQNVKFYGLKAEVPSLDDMKEELNRLRFFAFLLLCSVFPVVTSEGLGMDMEKLSDKTTNRPDSINLKVYTSEKFKRNVAKDIVTLMKEGVI